MHARSITPSSTEIISDLTISVESLIKEFQQITLSNLDIRDANSLEELEMELHKKAIRLADFISAMKLQEALNCDELNKAGQDLIKAHPKKMKDMGNRKVMIRMLAGTFVTIEATYYHQKSDSKLQSKKGFYPKLLLLGIHDRSTSALCSCASLFATAACSLEEAQRLMSTLYGFDLNIKTIRMICKRFAMRARVSFHDEAIPVGEEFKGRRVVISADGGRVRTRVNKRGKKTKKGRSRYKTDWREPKLILIYAVNENAEKDRSLSPIMDASLNGPDATFAMLLFYLKKLGVASADQLLFVSDGAIWIWDRLTDLIAKLGIESKQCSISCRGFLPCC